MRPLSLLVLLIALACHGSGSGGGSATVEAIGSGASCERDGSCAEGDDAVFVLGSSFSWDAQPQFLDGRPEWHIYCGKPLDFIFNNPYGHCLDGSTPWPEVLEPPALPFGHVTFQPARGEGITQEQDVSHITHWLADQPLTTIGVIHATWPVQRSWETQLHDANPDHTFTNYSIDYYYDLLEQLELANPGRSFILTRSNEMLDYIFHDGSAPIAFEALFRDDSAHMSLDYGRYLQHNALRQATGQEVGIDNSEAGLDPLILDYLDQVILLHPAY